MVEFLGPNLLGDKFVPVAQQIIKHTNSTVAAVRQAAAYGIGIMAEKSGAAFQGISNDALLGLKYAIEFQMPASVAEKKNKVKQFNHARDNAVSALGKIIKFQSGFVDAPALVVNWVGLLPIKNDIDEAKVQNDFLADILVSNPTLVLGEQYQRFEQIVILLSEITNEKYVTEETGKKLATIIKNMASHETFSQQFWTIVNNKLVEKAQNNIKNAINAPQ